MIVNIHVTKTAGTSSNLSIANGLGLEACPPKVLNVEETQLYDIQEAEIIEIHPLTYQHTNKFSISDFSSPEYYIFTFIRDPYQRMLSGCSQLLMDKSDKINMHIMKILNRKNFMCNHYSNFFNGRNMPIKELIALIEKHIDFIGIFENYLEDLDKLMKILNINTYEVQHNRATNKDYKYKFSQKISEELFIENNKLDYELYEHFANK